VSPVLPTLVAGLAGTGVAALAGPEGGAAGVAVATAVVLLFFAGGKVPLLLVDGQPDRAGVGFLVLMMTYALRLVGLLVVLTAAARSGLVDTRLTAVSVIVLTLVWTTAAVGSVLRHPGGRAAQERL
jgi:hypothetical protein